MASLLKRSNGNYSVRFMMGRRRLTMALGTKSASRAETQAKFIQDLATSYITGERIETETKHWLSNQSAKFRQRLADAGLIEPEIREAHTLAEFLADYIERYGQTKKGATVTTWRQCERLLLEFFPANTLLSSITSGDAEDFRNYLLTRSGDKGGTRRAKPLSEATTRRRCGCAKAFFAYAVRKKLIDGNPFDTKAIPTTAPRNLQKQFVTDEDARKILEKLPRAEWRLLFALARYGGMRVPSEPEALLWTDIDFDRKRINFRSPKTEHHDGKDRREIPLFPELVEPLRDVFELAEPGSEYVLPFLREITGTALRNPLLAAIEAAHLKPWPKLWNALRASRVTELREQFPAQVVDTWIGHDDTIARKHYAQTLDAHFERATQQAHHSTGSPDKKGEEHQKENRVIAEQNGTEAKCDEQRWAMRDQKSGPDSRGISRSTPARSIRADTADTWELLAADPALEALSAAWPALPPSARMLIEAAAEAALEAAESRRTADR